MIINRERDEQKQTDNNENKIKITNQKNDNNQPINTDKWKKKSNPYKQTTLPPK